MGDIKMIVFSDTDLPKLERRFVGKRVKTIHYEGTVIRVTRNSFVMEVNGEHVKQLWGWLEDVEIDK